MFFYRLFVLLLFAMKRVSALKCYSCGEENVFLGQEYSTPVPCNEFHKTDDLERFIIECPEDYLSCTTQITGDEVIRTCDTVAVDDCQTANGVVYCYCSQDLCNGKTSHLDTRKASRDVLLNYPSDDEDYSDMSGQGHPDSTAKEKSSKDTKHRSTYNNHSSQLFSKPQLFITLGLNLLLKTFFVNP